jgi:UPF0148 protein
MPERKEDEIMAEYLLKGGKMLEKTCKTCGCPLFEYKKKTFCVVCAEREQAAGQKTRKEPAGEKAAAPVKAQEKGAVTAAGAAGTARAAEIADELSATILGLCRRINGEEDPDRCLVLMDAVKIGAEALQILRQL